MQQGQPSGEIMSFIFENIPVRGSVLRIHDLVSHVPTLHHKDTDIAKSLAEMLTASAILNADLKNPANVNLQIHSSGDVPLMLAQCTSDQNLKAYIKKDTKEDASYDELSRNNAVFAVTVEPRAGSGDVYQSLIELNEFSISSTMEKYFNDSVQLKTYFKVFTEKLDDKVSCGAIFLQAMPQGETLDEFEDHWTRLGLLLSTIKSEEILPGELSKEELLFRLFAKDDQIRYFPQKELSFFTANARERMAKALESLGVKECKSLLDEGKIVIADEFNGQEEEFTEEDLMGIFGTGWEEE